MCVFVRQPPIFQMMDYEKFVIQVSGKYGGISCTCFLTIIVTYNMKLGTFWYLNHKTAVRSNHKRHPKF
jgi:hypothetical protein